MKILFLIGLFSLTTACTDDPSSVDPITRNTVSQTIPPARNNTRINNSKNTTKNNSKNNTKNTTSSTQNNQKTNNTNQTTQTNNTNNKVNEFEYFLLEDRTSGHGCQIIDPGSDIMWVELLDPNGEHLQWGQTTFALQGTGTKTNKFVDHSIIDGNDPKTDTKECVIFSKSTIYATGCGGVLLFSFGKGASLTTVPLGHLIAVGEYGETCGGSNDDSYTLFGCTDSLKAKGGDYTSCTVGFGPEIEGISIYTVKN